MSSLVTVTAIAFVAFALCDLVHEVVGHGIAALLVPGIDVLSLSSVALQTTGESRIVAAAGSMANVLIGIAALALFHRARRVSPGAFFLWLFGSISLLNGSGYPLYSAILGSGDWEVVVRGLQPAWAWRAGLGIIGAVGYTTVVVVSARELSRAVTRFLIARAEIPRLVFPAYIAGSALLVAASALNPIGLSLIFLSGVSSGFAAMAGLTVVPRLVESYTSSAGSGEVSFNALWVAAGLLVAGGFVAVLGPGLRF